MEGNTIKIKLDRDYHEDGIPLFRRANIELQQGITVLVGCNGSGKTTFIRQITNYCKYEKKKGNHIHCLSYNNLSDGGSHALSYFGYKGDIQSMVTRISSSEGEQIYENICNFSSYIGTFNREKLSQGDIVFIVMDAIDSGSSIDNIIDIKEFLKLVLNDILLKGGVPYIIIAANSYEMARDQQCYDVRSSKYITFQDYEEYRNFILQSRKKKDVRYKKFNELHNKEVE